MNLPAYKEFFKQDIVNNIKKKTIDYTQTIILSDLVDEAVYYSADMCLEFYNKSGYVLPQIWINHIVNETCSAFKELFKEFDDVVSELVRNRVNLMMSDKSEARRIIDNYYEAVNRKYFAYYR